MFGKRILSAIMLALSLALGAQTYKLALMDLPTTHFYKDLFDAISQQSGLKFEVQVVPPPRAGYLIANKQVDVQAPQLASKDPEQLKEVNYDYGSTVLIKSAFVLFTNKAKPIDIAKLKAGNPEKLVIETDGATARQFGFVASVSTNIAASLQKLNDGKIDGYIHSQTTSDAYAKKLELKNCKRQLYEYYDLNYALPKGERGGALDKALSDSIKKLRDSGAYDRILGAYIAAARYSDWQP